MTSVRQQRHVLRMAVVEAELAKREAVGIVMYGCEADAKAGTYTKERQGMRLAALEMRRESWFQAQDRLDTFEREIADTPPRPSQRFAILKRDAYRCQLCGATGKNAQLEVDHKHPRSQGGNNAVANLWTLCLPCNRGKGTQTL